MGRQRLEAFTDGVVAIIITIMVLDMKVPAGSDFGALRGRRPRISRLCAQLCQRGHFLEQPSPHAACDRANQWMGAVGESVLAVLAVAGAVRDPLDGRNAFCAAAHRELWRGAGAGGDRVQCCWHDRSSPATALSQNWRRRWGAM